MKSALWFVFIASCTGLAFWIVAGPWFAESPLEIAFVGVFFMAHPFGGFWMLYRALRYESQPIPYAFLAMFPYAFVWYYFERYRKRVGDGNI